jgi:hypothetical protein
LVPRACALAVLLLVASAVAAETVYKYRRADGQMLYSNSPVKGLELIDAFEYRFATPAPARPRAAQSAASAAAAEQRISGYLAKLDTAWSEVRDATRLLAQAEERLREGEEPQPGDRQGVVAESAPPAAGGAPALAPAAGGSMSGRRSRASPEYLARLQVLEYDAQVARARLDMALRRYNELR